MQLINLTPHEICVVADNAETVRIPASGTVARVGMVSIPEPDLKTEAGAFRITRNSPGEVVDLPAPQKGVVYIVSFPTAQAAAGRDDVICPDTGPTAIRVADGPRKGQIESVRGFLRY